MMWRIISQLCIISSLNNQTEYECLDVSIEEVGINCTLQKLNAGTDVGAPSIYIRLSLQNTFPFNGRCMTHYIVYVSRSTRALF